LPSLAATIPSLKQVEGSSILDLEANLPALARWSPLLARHKLPPVVVSIAPRGEYIRTEARVLLAEPLSWRFDPWRVPTNLISEPLTTFSVVQGIKPFLDAIPGLQELGLEHPPKQFCAWGQRRSFNTFCAFPMENASNVLSRIATNAPSLVKKFVEAPPGNLTYNTNKSELLWTGLPLAIPLIRSVADAGQDYFLFGLLPPSTRMLPPPSEIFAQLENRQDLVYYDWEITQDRLEQARFLYQIIDMTQLRTLASTNEPSFRWAEQVAPRLGNCVTEVVVTSPKELKLTRKSHIGFTGFELATLLRWLDSPNFPLDYEPPPSARNRSRGIIPRK